MVFVTDLTTPGKYTVPPRRKKNRLPMIDSAAGSVSPVSDVPPVNGVYVLVPGQVSPRGPTDMRSVLRIKLGSYHGVTLNPCTAVCTLFLLVIAFRVEFQ